MNQNHIESNAQSTDSDKNCSNSCRIDDQSLQNNQSLKIPITVVLVGIAMALMNISYVMCYTYTGPYLRSIGVTISKTGMLMGFCAIASQCTKLVSGFLSDVYRKRKNIFLFGYLLSLLGRFLLVVSTVAGFFSFGQILDRFGNGTAATPRDTIISDIAPKKILGSCFGLKRSLAYIGSVLGGCFALLFFKITDGDYKKIFSIALIPALLAMLIVAFFIKENNQGRDERLNNRNDNDVKPKKKIRFRLSKLNKFDKKFWAIIVINTIYMSAKVSETALILHINNVGGAETYGAIFMILINLGAMTAAYSSGRIGDRVGRRTNLILLSLVFFITAYTLFRCSGNASMPVIYIAILLWGMHIATSQNAFVSLVAEHSPKGLKGTGMGTLWLSTGIAEYFGDHFIGGYIHQHYGPNAMFFVGGLVCVFCLVLTMLISKTVINNGYNTADE